MYRSILDVKSVTKLMTGNETTAHRGQYTKSVNVPQQPITNGTHTNGLTPHKSPPLNSYANRKTPPGSHGKPSPLMQRRFDTNG